MTTLDFLGAAGTVTGSRHLLTAGKRKVLLDCGLFQGLKALRLRNWDRPPFEPRDLDAVVLSHAHIDHSGYLPCLVKHGFKGPVFCTPGTRDLLKVMLPDAAHLQEEEARYANRKGYSKHRPALPLYTEADAEEALKRLEARPYGKAFDAADGVAATFRNAGHILGAGTVNLDLGGLKLVFSGDLGRPGQPLLPDPEPPLEADVLLLESTYGDRIHPKAPEDDLARIVNDAAMRGGALLIPAFAVGRAQSLIHILDALRKAGRIPDLPVFLDSPMAARVSELMKASGRHTVVGTPEESKALNRREGPFLVVAGSGMITGGRILHHVAARAGDPRTTVLLAGFQAAGTRGRALQEGATELRMHGRWIPVKAKVEVLDGLSAHADRDEILGWLKGFPKPPRQTFLVHGEAGSVERLAETIRKELGWDVRAARDGERVTLVP